jgi:nucleotide-sensitive chloride channel 1A
MSLTTITTAPTADDFTPLSEHHEQTPGSFFAGKAVLHLQAPASKLQISKDELEATEAVKALVATTDDAAVNAEGFVEIQDIDVWVTSRYDCQRDTSITMLLQLANAQNHTDT